MERLERDAVETDPGRPEPSSNWEKSSSVMIFCSSGIEYPAASSDATMAPAEVPATRWNV